MKDIKVVNKTDIVYVLGVERGTIHFLPETPIDISFRLYQMRKQWFDLKRDKKIFEFDPPHLPEPVKYGIKNPDITLKDIETNTGEDKEPVKEEENTSDKLSQEEIDKLDSMSIDELRAIAKRVGAATSRKSSELVENIKKKIAE